LVVVEGCRIENFPVEFEFLLEDKIELLCLVSLIRLLIFLVLSLEEPSLPQSVDKPEGFAFFNSKCLDFAFYFTYLEDSAPLSRSFSFKIYFFSIIFSYLAYSFL
jgi:hypothetical protein